MPQLDLIQVYQNAKQRALMRERLRQQQAEELALRLFREKQLAQQQSQFEKQLAESVEARKERRAQQETSNRLALMGLFGEGIIRPSTSAIMPPTTGQGPLDILRQPTTIEDPRAIEVAGERVVPVPLEERLRERAKIEQESRVAAQEASFAERERQMRVIREKYPHVFRRYRQLEGAMLTGQMPTEDRDEWSTITDALQIIQDPASTPDEIKAAMQMYSTALEFVRRRRQAMAPQPTPNFLRDVRVQGAAGKLWQDARKELATRLAAMPGGGKDIEPEVMDRMQVEILQRLSEGLPTDIATEALDAALKNVGKRGLTILMQPAR